MRIVNYLLLFKIIFLFSCSDKISNNPLKDYVNKVDESFRYEVIDSIRGDDWSEIKIKMVSGNWMDSDLVENNEWWHMLNVIIPDDLIHNESMMIISSGSTDNYDDKISVPKHIIDAAISTKSIISIINNIPFQPTVFSKDNNKKRYEDDLIAYGWRKFLERGSKKEDEEWLARFPMTRAVSRAMDVVQEVGNNNIVVDSFFVTGASKRGWTAWTSAIADDRVMGIAPVVIDMLNVYPSFKHHWRVYGDWSPAINDYIHHGIMDYMGSNEYKRLTEIVEPYSYRDILKLPKYIVNASSDEFFVTDSWKFYWDNLIGKKHIRYVPNAGHGLYGRYVTNDIISYYSNLINNYNLPEYSWDVSDSLISVKIFGNEKYSIKKWMATNEKDRDFRKPVIGESWISSDIEINESGSYTFNLEMPQNGFSAIFYEIVFNEETEFPISITTGTKVLPEIYPFDDFVSKNPSGTR
tara:strand:+ start:3 stop:1400 length:1398 start_codon:yes stop_codon:yes gene_type:complete